MAQHSMAQHSMAQHSMAEHSTAAHIQALRPAVAKVPKQHQGHISICARAGDVTGENLSGVLHIQVMRLRFSREQVTLNEAVILIS